jgi:hypothetical protein
LLQNLKITKLQNYKITNQAALVRIAKNITLKDGYIIANYIERFGITALSQVVEILKLAAKQNGNYAINQTTLIQSVN